VEINHPAANEPMPAQMRLSILKERHRRLDRELIDLQLQPLADQLHVRRLKREKLRLRDAIETLKDELIPDIDA
jgi:hypothetical protein